MVSGSQISPTMLLFRVSFFIVLLYLSRLSVHVWAKMMSIWYSWRQTRSAWVDVQWCRLMPKQTLQRESVCWPSVKKKKKAASPAENQEYWFSFLNDTTQKDYGFLQHISVRHLSFSGSIHHFTCSLARTSSTDLTGHLSLICLTRHCADSEPLQGCRCFCLWLLSAPPEQHSVCLDICLMDPKKIIIYNTYF